MVEILPVGVAVDHAARRTSAPSCSARARRPRLWGPASAGGRSRNSGPAASGLRGRGSRCRRARRGPRWRRHARPARRDRRATSTARSMPAPSMDLSRSSPKSVSRATTCARIAGSTSLTVGLPVVLEARAQEMLFERDLRNHSFLVRFRRAPCTVVWSGCTRLRNRASSRMDQRVCQRPEARFR